MPRAQLTAKHPRKAMYRARAHSNPFNDPIYDVPPHPDDMDWWGGARKGGARGWQAYGGLCQPLHSRAAACLAGAKLQPQPLPPPPRSEHFPERVQSGRGASTSGGSDPGGALVRFADIGCGFGGLLIK